MRPSDVDDLGGGAAKARAVLAWVPKPAFADMLGLMVDAELRRHSAARQVGA